jgi:ribosome maturation factor RimP
MNFREQIEEISRPVVESLGAFIVDVNIRGNLSGKVIEIYVDTDAGITIDACSEISRKVSLAFDTANLIPHRYHLIVSSPGIDRSLKLLRQYRKNVGRKMLVHSSLQVEKILGELVEVGEKDIMLRDDEKNIRTIPFDTIVSAFVQTKW